MDGSSDSDDDTTGLQFNKIFAKRSTSEATSVESSPEKKNRLDDLLADHVRETENRVQLDKAKEQLLANLDCDSDEETSIVTNGLASEHRDHLDQFDVKSSLPLTQPGISLFYNGKAGCLFSENISPLSCGFTPSDIPIDKLVATSSTDMLGNLVLSKALVTSASKISDIEHVLLWLFNMLAVQKSPVLANSCFQNFNGILSHLKRQTSSVGDTFTRGCLHPLDIFRVFVNMGADPDELGANQVYGEDEISKYLTSTNDENEQHPKASCRTAAYTNVQLVFKAVEGTLKERSYKVSYSKEELNFIFFMLAKVELDTHINNLINIEAQSCFDAILQSYSITDWPCVVPSLCRCLQEVSEHHHNQVHTANLLLATKRGSFLKTRFSFLCLRALLLPDLEELTDNQILNFKLSDVPNLSGGQGVLLSTALQSVLERDVYYAMSAVQLLGICTDSSLHTPEKCWKSLELLANQADLTIHFIRDKISKIDLSKIKNFVSNLKCKWSLALQEHPKTKMSILPWIHNTGKNSMKREIVSHNDSIIADELEDDL